MGKRIKTISFFFYPAIFTLCLVFVTTWRQLRQVELNRELITSIKEKHPAQAMEALERGADPNAQDDAPTLSLAQFPKCLTRIRLAHTKRNVHALDLVYWNPDTNTIPRGDHYLFVKALLDYGANPNAENDANPPIVYAAALADWPSVHEFISRGACDHNINLCNLVLHQVIMLGNPYEVEALLNKGADVNYSAGGYNMLIYAVRNNDQATIKRLLNRGADPNVMCSQASTPLKEARSRNLVSIEHILRQAGAKN